MMTLNYLNQFQFENYTHYIKFNPIQFQITCLIVGLVNIFTNRKKIHKIFLGLHSSIQYYCSPCKSTKNQNALVKKENKFEHSVSRGDLEIVLRNLGVLCNAEKLPESYNPNDISTLFDEKNIILDEVKEAFDMFDKNGDGFIDAEELQMVLCALGLQQGLDYENCRRMIGVFDKDGDEKMDFVDFLEFMEITLS